jgi:putative ABC transport system permease protein
MTSRGPVGAFRFVLRIFPADFRALYGDDMEAFFCERWRAARRGWPKFEALISSLSSLAINGARERWRSSLHPPLSSEIRARERARSVGGFMSNLFQDGRYALRLLRRQPGYALFIIVTLAVGIGATTAVFSVVNSVLLKSLPLEDSDRLVAVWSRFDPESGFDFPQFPLSIPEFVDYRAQSKAMEDVAAWAGQSLTVAAPGAEPDRVIAAAVTPNLFPLLRVQPAVGRLFSEMDGRPGSAPLVLLNYDYWRSRFGGDRSIAGRIMQVNGVSATIVGVLPEGFSYPGTTTQVWTPLRIDPGNPGNRKGHMIRAIGRVVSGVSLDSAEVELRALMAAWKAQYPDVHTGHYLFIRPLLDDVSGTIRPALLLLFGATGFVLLIVCANVATMVLARGESRGREMAIRGALGAGRRRLITLSLVESIVLALIGGTLGAAMAYGGVRGLLAIDPAAIPRSEEIGIDATMLAFAAGMAIVSAVLFGLMPAIRGAAAVLQSTLRESTHSLTTGSGRLWLQRTLVAVEVALAALLVIGAGLMLRSFNSLMSVNPGFAKENLLMAGISLPPTSYREPERVEAFYESLMARIREIPGVQSASATTGVPLWSDSGVWDFDVEGRARPGQGEVAWNAGVIIVRPGFFETLQVPLVRGRSLVEQDRNRSMPVTVINEAMAARFFAGTDPIGQRIRVAGANNSWMTIVGICGDIRDQSLDASPRPMYYLAHSQLVATGQDAERSMSLLLRAKGQPEALSGALREVVRQMDGTLPLFDVQTLDTIIDGSVARPRFTTVLLAIFALVGVILGASGVYGVLAYTVARRTQEIGIRRALGAGPAALLRDMLSRAMRPVIAGLLAGLCASFWLMQFLESQLFGISPTDTPTYIGVVAGILFVSLAACLIPARRAMKVDAMVAMRQ